MGSTVGHTGDGGWVEWCGESGRLVGSWPVVGREAGLVLLCGHGGISSSLKVPHLVTRVRATRGAQGGGPGCRVVVGRGEAQGVGRARGSCAPGEPSVSSASVSSLNVNWTAPDNAGPPITDYDVQYRAGTSGPWTDLSHSGAGVTATITGLEENTSYQVQVGATNAEGTGAWSPSGSGATDANAAPAFESPTTFDAAENQTAVGTVRASDSDGADTVTGYALSGGADQALFSINDSGVLTFQAAPNYEDAQDANTDNAYEVTVQATSGMGEREKTETQSITVTVTDAGGEAPSALDAPSVSSASVTSLNVNWTAPDNAGPEITDYDYRYRTTSPQGAWMAVTNTTITALSATITGLAENTEYDVQVRATNDEGTSGWSSSGSGATDANAAPAFTSPATVDAAENQTAAGTVRASDADAGDTVTGYAITGGADMGFFSIGETSGALTFDDAPNFEDPKDQGAGNTYEVTVQATSGAGERVKTATQTITVTVTDANEQPDKPAKPTLAAVSGSATSLTATWVKPGLNGGPEITGYNVNYRVSTVTAWETFTHSGAGVTRTITGLTASTSYQVRVQALNGETPSAFSDPSDAVSTNTETPSEINAYWTESDTTKGSNLQVAFASTEPFRAFWLPPVKSVTGNTRTYKVADEWEAEVTSKNGASGESYTIQNTNDNPEYPELTGTVRIDGSGSLSIRVRGRFGADGWGAWSPRTGLYCTAATETTTTTPTITAVAVTSTPMLTSSRGSTPDTYGAGEEIEFTVTFNEAVEVTGDPQFGFRLAGARVADLDSGSGSERLTFVYTVQPTDQDDDGIWVGNHASGNKTLQLDADDAITSLGGTDANLEHDTWTSWTTTRWTARGPRTSRWSRWSRWATSRARSTPTGPSPTLRTVIDINLPTSSG